jgi:hypothetical protein
MFHCAFLPPFEAFAMQKHLRVRAIMRIPHEKFTNVYAYIEAIELFEKVYLPTHPYLIGSRNTLAIIDAAIATGNDSSC